MSSLYTRLKPHISNVLADVTPPIVTGIVGEQPSKYAKTPPLWNAVYRALKWDAISLAWDVTPAALPGFVAAARAASEIAGFSVTNPHKIAIVPLLDDLDPLAARIGAVNTVARDTHGRLVGYNTDGQGAIDALTLTWPGQDTPFLASLTGANVVLIGAGGAARALAFYLSDRLGPRGALRIVTRNGSQAEALAAAVRDATGVGDGGGESRLPDWIASADLVVNASVKGQTGWRRLHDGGACLLEPYSALAPATPPVIAAGRTLDAEAAAEWQRIARPGILENARRALDALGALAPPAACFDAIYAPLETRFLFDARLAGHPTQNGKWMNVAQAADGFARRVFPEALTRGGTSVEDGYRRAFEIMASVW